MATFRIYGDESGKLSTETADYTSFCGYIGHCTEWDRFETEWFNNRIKWGVPPLHMSRIMFPDRKDDSWLKVKQEWGTRWEEMRESMLDDFAATIFHASIICVGAVVDSSHFRKLCQEDPLFKKYYRDPIHLSLHMFVMEGIEQIETVDKYSPISIVIDDDRQFSMDCYNQLIDLKDLLPKVKERLRAICFVNDDTYGGIQAADLISYEARRMMVARKENPDCQLSKLFVSLTRRLIHKPKFYSPESLDRLREINPLRQNTAPEADARAGETE